MDIRLLLNPLPNEIIPSQHTKPPIDTSTTAIVTSATSTTRHAFKKISKESDESASHQSSSSEGETDDYASSNSPPPKQKTRIQHAQNKKRANKEQLKYLESEFLMTQFPSTMRKADIGVHLGMSAVSVSVWFQNKRQILKAQKEANGETVIKGRGRRGDLV